MNLIYINNSPIVYTKSSCSSNINNQQYLQITEDNEYHLVATTSIMGKIYRGVTRDGVFWFLVEDLVELNHNSHNRLELIERLLNNISNEHKGFIGVVDSVGNREFVLMVSLKGLVNKLFN